MRCCGGIEAKWSDKSAVVSRRSSWPSGTSASGAVRARTNAEAAKVRATFAEEEAKAKIQQAKREAEYQKEKAINDVELNMLAVSREAAVTEAEVALWETAEAMDTLVILDEIGPSEDDKMEGTNEYIQAHFSPKAERSQLQHDSPPQPGMQGKCIPQTTEVKKEAPEGERVNSMSSNRLSTAC